MSGLQLYPEIIIENTNGTLEYPYPRFFHICFPPELYYSYNDMVSWTSVAASWSVFGGAVILGWWYYTQDGKRRRIGRVIDPAVSERVDRKRSGNPTKQKKDKQRELDASEPPSSDAAETSAAEFRSGQDTEGQLQQRKKEKKPRFVPLNESSAADKTPATGKTFSHDDSDGTDAAEFARQMSKAKAGTSFTAPQKAKQRVKTQKQSKHNGALDSFGSTDNIQSGTSSNTGADADDDLSPAVSPPLPAADAPADATGVADMLGPVETGPSSLRITEPLQPPKGQQPAKVKKEDVAETKKQRQARARREREREVQREAEAQRKVLEEKQRRTAREAEGRPAKNGNGWTYASGLPANAWTQGNAAPTAPQSTADGPLLDTWEESAKADVKEVARDLETGAEKILSMIKPTSTSSTGTGAISSNGRAASEASQPRDSSRWENGLPSEEEQIRMFQEQSEDAAWTTVAIGKRGKRRPVPEPQEKSVSVQQEVPDFDVTI